MKCQILFSRKSKKNIVRLSSAGSAHSMVSVKLKVFNNCKQTMNKTPEVLFFNHEF